MNQLIEHNRWLGTGKTGYIKLSEMLHNNEDEEDEDEDDANETECGQGRMLYHWQCCTSCNCTTPREKKEEENRMGWPCQRIMIHSIQLVCVFVCVLAVHGCVYHWLSLGAKSTEGYVMAIM